MVRLLLDTIGESMEARMREREVLYLDADAAIRFCPLPSEQMILVVDTTLEENIVAAIRRYRVYGLDGMSYNDYVDVYDAQCVTVYDYSGAKHDDHGGNRYFWRFELVRSRFRAHRLFSCKFFHGVNKFFRAAGTENNQLTSDLRKK